MKKRASRGRGIKAGEVEAPVLDLVVAGSFVVESGRFWVCAVAIRKLNLGGAARWVGSDEPIVSRILTRFAEDVLVHEGRTIGERSERRDWKGPVK